MNNINFDQRKMVYFIGGVIYYLLEEDYPMEYISYMRLLFKLNTSRYEDDRKRILEGGTNNQFFPKSEELNQLIAIWKSCLCPMSSRFSLSQLANAAQSFLSNFS